MTMRRVDPYVPDRDHECLSLLSSLRARASEAFVGRWPNPAHVSEEKREARAAQDHDLRVLAEELRGATKGSPREKLIRRELNEAVIETASSRCEDANELFSPGRQRKDGAQ